MLTRFGLGASLLSLGALLWALWATFGGDAVARNDGSPFFDAPPGSGGGGGGIGGGGTVTGDTTWNDGVGLYWGSLNDAVCLYDTVQTPDSWTCGVSSDSNRMLVTTQALAGVSDLGFPLASDPTITVTDDTGAEAIELTHDTTDAQITSTAGDIGLNPAGGDVTLSSGSNLQVLGGGEILGNAVGGNNPTIQFGSDSVTMNRQNGTALSLLNVREVASLTKLSMASGTAPVRWSAATQIDSGGLDGRFRWRNAANTDGACMDFGSGQMNFYDDACTGQTDITVQSGSRLCFTGSSCLTRVDGLATSFNWYLNGQLRLAHTVPAITYVTQEFVLSNNTGGAEPGTPKFILRRVQNPGAVGQGAGELQGVAYDASGGSYQEYGRIRIEVGDATAGDADGKMYFQLTNDGTSFVEYFNCDATDTAEDCTYSVDHEQYGEMYVDTAQTVTITLSSTWTQVSDFTGGIENGMTFSAANDDIDVTSAGNYQVTATMSASTSGANQTVRFGISVDDTVDTKCQAQRILATGSDVGSWAITCMLALTAGQDIGLYTQNETSTNDVVVEFANVNISQL